MAKVTSIANARRNGRILFVAYPLLPVSDRSAGGAEQVLASVEREAKLSGYQTTLAACNGSAAEGQSYFTVMPARGRLASARAVESDHCRRVRELISVRAAIGTPFDLVHDHSGTFFSSAPHDVPVLATLHLPRSFYPNNFFNRLPANVYLNCVSRAQARTFSDLPNMLGVVRNGVSLDRFPLRLQKQEYLLWMGRICEEKGTHTALDLAKKTGMRFVIVGQVYPLAYHRDYYERQIVPRLRDLGEQVRFVERPTFAEKLSLLQDARALLVTSSAEETSCLVAMEAAACGTPVIALRRGAFPEVVKHGVTGMVVDDMQQMQSAIADIARIKPRTCREYAQQNFSAARMFAEYEQLYDRIRARPSVATTAATQPSIAA